MTQMNDPIDPKNPGNIPPNEPGRSPTTPPPKKRRGRRWLKVLIGLVVALVILVLLIPTIAGMGFVRSIVVGRVNGNLNGHVEIDDWSLGWFGGIHVKGVRIYDEAGTKIASIDSMATDLSLLDAIRGSYHLGKTSISGLDFLLKVDENGETNFDKLAKTSATKKAKEHPETTPKEPAKLPEVTGDFSIDGKGDIDVAGKPVHHVKSLKATATITGINDPIKHQADVQFALGDGPPCTVSLGGTVSAIKNNVVDRDHLSADEELKLSNIDLASANAFIGKNLTIGGSGKGDLKIKVTGPTSGSVDGSLGVDNAVATGPALNGDTYKTNINIPLNVSSDGTTLTITTLNVDALHFSAKVNGKLGIAALQNIAHQQPPGPNGGSLDVHLAAPDLAPIVSQLKNAIALLPDVTVTGGEVAQDTHLDIGASAVAIHNDLSFSAQGTKAGQPIAISKVEIKKVDTTFDPTKQSLAGLANVGVDLSSPFLSLTGGGSSLSKLDIKGNFDLNKLNQQLAQFVDLSKLQMRGTGQFAITSNGDVTAANQPVAATLNASVNNLSLTLPNNSQIKWDSLTLAANASVTSDKINQASLKLQTTDAGKPIVNLDADAQNIDLTSQSVGHFNVGTCSISDLNVAQQQFGSFVPSLAANGIHVVSGQLYTNVSGSVDGKTRTIKLDKPLEVSTPNLTVQKVDASGAAQDVVRDEKITANILGDFSLPPDGTISADLKNLSVQTQHNLFALNKDPGSDFTVKRDTAGNFAANGTVTLAADLKALSDIANRFKPPTTEPTTEPADEPANEGQLTSGQLNATIALSHADKPETVAQITGSMKNLSVATADPKHPISNETVNLSIAARTDDKFSAASASGKIDSSLGTVNLNSLQVLLTDAKTGKPVGTLQMVQNADIAVSLPDLVKVQGVINAFTPAPPTAAKSQANAASHLVIPPTLAIDGLLADDSADTATPKKKKKPKAHEQTNAAPSNGAEETEPEAPLQLTSGSLNLAVTVSRDAAQNATNVTVTNLSIDKLAIQRGSHSYAFDPSTPITFKLDAQINAVDDPNKTVMQQISAVKVATLQGDLRVAALSMPTPITITNLADHPQANGAIAVNGKLDAITPLLAAVQQSNPLPYGGDFALTEAIASKSDEIDLTGDITANQFTVYNVDAKGRKSNAAFTEPQVAIKNDLAIDPKTSDAKINTLSVNMPQSQAVGLQLTGAVHDYANQRKLDNVKMQLSYDLAKVWPILHPMLLTPGQPDSYKDLVIEGVEQKNFNISGSYPATVGGHPAQWWESIRTVNADGGIAAKHFVYKGVTVDDFDLPITITNGLLKTPASTKSAAVPEPVANATPAAPNASPTNNVPGPTTAPGRAICNQGTLDLGDIALDLGQEDPVLSVAKNHRLTQSIRLNPVMADAVGSATLLFKDASQASGLLDVTIVECKSVPLGDLIAKRPNAKATVTFSITQMKLDAPAPQVVATALELGDQGLQGDIKDGKITLENGQVDSDFSVQVTKYKQARKPKKGETVEQPQGNSAIGGNTGAAIGQMAQELPLHFSGGVDLGTESLKNFAVNIPAALIPDSVNKLFGNKVDIAQLFPNGLTVPFTGTTSSFKFDLQKALVENGPANLLNGAGGNGQDAIQNLLNGLGGNKKKKDKNSQ